MGWKGLVIFLAVLAIAAAALWFGYLQPKPKAAKADKAEAAPVEAQATEAPTATDAPAAEEAQPAAEEKAVSPETGMELYDLADFWLAAMYM